MSQSQGLFASAKNLASTVLGIAQTRLELFASEMEEDRSRMMRLILFCVFTFFFFFHGMVLLALLLIMMFWETHRLLVIGLISATYLCIAAGLAFYVMHKLKHKPKLFSASLAELAKDRAMLGAEE